MARINAGRPQTRAPRLISTTPGAPTARNMLAPVGDAIERVAAERKREADIERARADRIATARAESAFMLEIGRSMDTAAADYDGSAPGFAESQEEIYDAAAASALEAAPDSIRPELEARFAGTLRARHILSAAEVERAAAGRYVYQGFLGHVDATANAVTGEPGYFPDALATIEDAVAALPEALQPRARAEAIDQVSRSYAEARLNSDPRGFMAEMDSGELDPVFSAEVRRSYASQAQNEIERQDRAARIEASQAAASEARVLGRMLDDAEAASEQGFSPQVSFAAIGARAAAIGGGEGADLARRADEAAQLAVMTEDLRLLPPAELAARLDEERGRLRDGASGFEARRVETAEQVLTNMRSALNSDPVSYARRTGLGNVPDLDLSSAQGLGASLAVRASRAQAVADHYGVERKIFTRDERTALSEAIARGDLDRLTAAQTIVSSLGPDAPAALAEIAPDEPLLASVGGLMSAGAETAARDLASGYQLRRADGFVSRLPRAAAMQAGANLMGDLAARLPETSLELADAAGAIYEARAMRQGLVSEGEGFPRGGEDLYKRALHEAAGAVYVNNQRYGGLVEHRGGTVIAPNWLAEDRMDDALRAIAGGEIGPRAMMADAGGRPLSMDVLERARLQSIGDQRYLVITGRDGGAALTDEGAPFVLDLSSYRRGLSRAYPEWVR